VTRELGRQTELEVTKQLEREVDADRFTALDRMLIAEQQGREFSDLRPDQDMRETFRQNRALLIERARKLERMGLATEIETGKWIVSPKAEPTLRELGERGDIIKTIHRALAREGLAEDRHPARYVLHRETATECIVGRVVQIDHDNFGARIQQQLAAETGHSTLVDNSCTALVQRLAQLAAQFGVVKQQGNGRCRFNHDSAPTHAALVLH